MILRLVLVGMVAALGITIPTRREILDCVGAFHSWSASCLASLDHSSRRDEEPAIGLMPVSGSRPRFVPIRPDERRSTADELNEFAEGRDLPSDAVLARHRRPDIGRGQSGGPREGRLFFGVPTVEMMELNLMAGLIAVVEESSVKMDRSAEPKVESPRPRKEWPSIPCTFTPSSSIRTARKTGTLDRPEELAPRGDAPSTMDRIEPMEDTAADVGMSLNRFAEGMVIPEARPIATEKARHASALIDPTVTTQTSLVDELNQASDGCSPASTPSAEARSTTSLIVPARTSDHPAAVTSTRPSVRGPGTEFARALRLTRDAAHAWMGVLAGPTPVQVSAR